MAAIQSIELLKEQNGFIQDAITKHRNRLFGFIRNRVADITDAEDILQDVFYEFTESTRFAEPVEQVASWLYRVARNKIIDRYRKKSPERLEDLSAGNPSGEGEPFFLEELIPSDTTNPDDQFDNSLLMNAVETALEELPKEQREVFVMHELENKSFREISESTGATINTLLSRKRYAVLHLRSRLNELYNELFN